jgi:hypothetical protein
MNEHSNGVTSTDTSDRCPMCGRLSTAATSVDRSADPRPTPGDVSLCFGCGEILVYGDDLKLRAPELEELRLIQRSSYWPLIDRITRAIREKSYARKT